MLHAMWLGEITIRHRQVRNVRKLLANRFNLRRIGVSGLASQRTPPLNRRDHRVV
jgi:hypothetical protein